MLNTFPIPSITDDYIKFNAIIYNQRMVLHQPLPITMRLQAHKLFQTQFVSFCT